MTSSGRVPPAVGSLMMGSREVDCTAATTDDYDDSSADDYHCSAAASDDDDSSADDHDDCAAAASDHDNSSAHDDDDSSATDNGAATAVQLLELASLLDLRLGLLRVNPARGFAPAGPLSGSTRGRLAPSRSGFHTLGRFGAVESRDERAEPLPQDR